MALRRIIWTEIAKNKWMTILDFYIIRNKSRVYSNKLNNKVQNELTLLLKHPQIGKKTVQFNVRILLIEDYFFYYEIKEKDIIILSVRNSKQNPDGTI